MRTILHLKKNLILFDIDGTLITSGGAGEHALRLGFKDRFGIDDDLSTVEIAGPHGFRNRPANARRPWDR